ncbi:hypothetical protein UFOVP46_129 [uncultured Caudovirales phage]|uniref:Uncharacterized protein n=1 Tax=uncultured Caudovirales phage TaxID=2100421 RepID=A0A6J5KRQ7_9CAUD|nr:hypothetical protein UFOVP46_129 [uncultured Caudovirales phage]
MSTCANCKNDALYTYEVTDTFSIDYCQYHLPRFLHTMKNGGMLKTTEAFAAETSDALAALAPAEEAVEEAPKPSKKKAAVVDGAPVEATPTE